ncbi:hypothetical protein V757_01660 [Pelistega indica]|uniref:LTXXQ motif family protein n=1 Tax=Pelistega indica TaxID=1414851 RepID=V8GAW8_9BURK|nr:Spy/CpxP family protein refolding chaperone [Pelistega indica]ETD72872.1 hypothetical protein V757_01660 [Pelistega indica]
MKTFNIKNFLALSAIALGVSVGSSYAVTPSDAQGKMPQNHRFELNGEKLHHEGMGPFHPRLIESLKLTDEQKTKFDDLRKVQKEAWEKRAQGFKNLKELREKQLESGDINFSALFAEEDKIQAEASNDKQTYRSKLVAFWDSLTADQKAQVIKDQKEHKDHFKDRQRRHGDEHFKKMEPRDKQAQPLQKEVKPAQ